ncbi:unnamed protein product [Rotaria sp. Silwood2]|nr:unnamed protein product [Rotaria sp. Silwood2]CAF4257374.1 unnamed protein product [Rotaria sp. Silwood2]
MVVQSNRYLRRYQKAAETFPRLTLRRLRAAFVRQTTQLLECQNSTVNIKGVEYTLNKLLGHGGQGMCSIPSLTA